MLHFPHVAKNISHSRTYLVTRYQYQVVLIAYLIYKVLGPSRALECCRPHHKHRTCTWYWYHAELALALHRLFFASCLLSATQLSFVFVVLLLLASCVTSLVDCFSVHPHRLIVLFGFLLWPDGSISHILSRHLVTDCQDHRMLPVRLSSQENCLQLEMTKTRNFAIESSSGVQLPVPVDHRWQSQSFVF